jgi:hypothetical protein
LKKELSKTGTDADENHLFWFPFNANEWLADRDIRLMKDYQRGWYIQLKVESWRDCGTLPNDPNTLWKLAGAESKEFFERENSPVMAKFENVEMDGKPVLLHRRLQSLYAKQDKSYQQKCDAARISADKRRQDKGREAGEERASQQTDKVTTVN